MTIGPFRAYDNRQLKILIGEDDMATVESLKQIFASNNCLANIYSTGEELLDALPKKDYDMMWIKPGIVMHGIGGYEVAKIIRAKTNPLARIPIYLFTSDEYHQCEKQARELEINGYIRKPFTDDACKELLAYMKEKF